VLWDKIEMQYTFDIHMSSVVCMVWKNTYKHSLVS